MRDMREGVCPVCAHQEILETTPAEFGDGDMERVAAVTYEPRWLLGGRNPGHPHGPLRRYVCRGCGYTQLFALDPMAIPIGEGYRTALLDGPSQRAGDGRRVKTTHAAIYLGQRAVEQVWPDGSVHSVVWADPFTCSLHRSPASPDPQGRRLIHVKLQQPRPDHLAIVAFSLWISTAASLDGLPQQAASLPVVLGADAEALLGALRAHAPGWTR